MFYSNLDIDFTIVSSYFIEPINLYKSGATPLVLLLLLLLAVPSLLTLHQLSDELQLITHKKIYFFSSNFLYFSLSDFNKPFISIISLLIISAIFSISLIDIPSPLNMKYNISICDNIA